MHRIFRLMRLGIQLLFIFDGDERPSKKKGRKSKLGTAGGNIALLKELLDNLRVPWHQAPGEAEAECGRLQQLGVVDAVWSEGNDAFMFGCRVLVKKTKDPDVVEIFHMEDVEGLGFSKERIALFAVLSGCDYTDGLVGCGAAVALKVVQSEAVQEGDFVEQFWDMETPSERFVWGNRLKSVLPSERSRENVHDRKFAPLEVLRSCRNPIVSRRDRLEQLRHGHFRGYTVQGLITSIPFLQSHFNRNEKPTWPLHHLAPIEVAHRLLHNKGGARDLVEAFKHKSKPRLTSPIQIDPARVFLGIDDAIIQVSLFGATAITKVDCELLDAICVHGISHEDFQQWRESTMTPRVRKKRPREVSSSNASKKRVIPFDSNEALTGGSLVTSRNSGDIGWSSNKRKAKASADQGKPSFEQPWRRRDDKFWELDISSQETVDESDDLGTLRKAGTESTRRKGQLEHVDPSLNNLQHRIINMDKFAATEGIEPFDSYSRMEPFSPNETAIDRDLRLRIRDFYRTSDNKDLNDRWLEFFTPDAKVKIGPQEAEKHDCLRQLRTEMWSPVSARKHWITSAIGSVTEHGVHVMLKGGVKRKGLDGNESTFSWAGSAAWAKYNGEWRMGTYRVWLDQWAPIEGPLPPESNI
ncbi:uncharacterized protein CTRU02_212823 [Colletotrichum truncatum]|uniref:Uncharacterized protein n=1 Tax=Colletotrichum truncatum TaxID=5467 RepID=A0ACC3YJ13_COLTU|nr:uncharacterized protein CTRU02_03144 [Colletotrichum truncatum]KAF6797113.1 hypothetical protein CTRU02_03144 [Colletotrichum truncatum]